MWFEGYKSTLLDLLHEFKLCVLLSELGMLVAPKAHGEGLVSKIFTQIVATGSSVYS